MTDGCGPSFSEFARYSDPDGCWVKTSQGCSQRLIQWDDEADCLEPFSETWPRSATVWNTTAYRLQVLARSTGVTGSGSWPTPDAVHRGAAAPDLIVNYSKVRRRGSGQVRGMNLQTAVQVFPTPTSRDWKDTPGMAMESVNPDGSRRDRTELLPRRIYSQIPEEDRKSSGQLNPTWVEWLMGYPLGWTDLEV